MRKTASARSIAEALADNTAGRSSIRRRFGDGDANLADVKSTITRVGAEPEAGRGMARAGSTAWKHADSTACADRPAEAGPSYRTCTRSPLRRRGVIVPGLMSTIHELWMTRTNQEGWISMSVLLLLLSTQSERAVWRCVVRSCSSSLQAQHKCVCM